MKTRFFVFVCFAPFLPFLAGCGTTNAIEEAMNRLAIVSTDSTNGSAVSIGRGYFLSARHTVLKKDSSGYYPKVGLLYGAESDSSVQIVAYEGDVVLLKSLTLGKSDQDISFEYDIGLGQLMVWVQPIFYGNKVSFYVRTERVARIDKSYIYLDKYFTNGSSGGGIYTADGKLAALMDLVIVFFDEDDPVFRNPEFGAGIKTRAIQKLLEYRKK